MHANLTGIHPNYAGYSALLYRSWQLYWSRFFPTTRTATAHRSVAKEEQEEEPGSPVPLGALDEAAYRREAGKLGVPLDKVEAVVAWHKNSTNLTSMLLA